MRQLSNDNAANRASFVGSVYNVGEKTVKDKLLDSFPSEWSRLHRQGYIHIHDLDAYGKTYNCLTFDVLPRFPYRDFIGLSETAKVIRLFGYFKTMFADMGNEQSGGMAFANFDNEFDEILRRLEVTDNSAMRELISSCIGDFIVWCNNTHSRMGQTSYYITLNIGLACNDRARFIAYTVIDEFEKAGDTVYKPNIVFKVSDGVNRKEGDRNFDLFQKALLCTAKKMIPTYLLCDCEEDKAISAEKLSVMGCRTRVVDDLFGCQGATGRGNIANISINLPRLALETEKKCKGMELADKIISFRYRWLEIAETATEILVDRYNKTLGRAADEFPANTSRQMWCVPFGEPSDVFKHGTLSIGFIGLSEAVEVLTGSRFYNSAESYQVALDFVEFMRSYCDEQREKLHLNFSLLATSGELISGRFIDIDKNLFESGCDIFTKGFYTNSFHVNVDSGISAREKLHKEGPFHILCNGGSISYIELNEAPIGNDEGLMELVEEGIKVGVRYLGINFPKDICNNCSASGVFDICPVCGSKDITRIRRVSGYLEVLDGFTRGKKSEVKTRSTN